MEKLVHSAKKHNKGGGPSLWVTASGKGGAGKTFVTSSLAITLTKLGYSVIIVDLDAAGANVHTALGQNPAPVSLRNWLEGQKDLAGIVTPTNLPRLSFVQGLWDSWCPIELSVENMRKLAAELRTLRCDFVLVDLGPGATEAHLELFRGADEKILVSTPEPTSIEKTYRFLEAYICSTLRDSARPEAFEDLLKTLREHRHRRHKKPFSFRGHLREHEGFQIDHFEALSRSPVRLVINACRSQVNAELGYSMKSVCSKYYDLGLDFLGALDFDNAVWQSVKNKEQVLIAQPFTPLAGQFLAVCKHLIAPEELRAVG
ncbi:MAG: P-loop NTPase [Bdellovibrionaceae bacterium]|nr:P-loop NTPase [Pseudobdellovibrionaceae bacterium]MBX3033733.1 P-loop NTPase [Pseudobdellovibrionaceae bacterium]